MMMSFLFSPKNCFHKNVVSLDTKKYLSRGFSQLALFSIESAKSKRSFYTKIPFQGWWFFHPPIFLDLLKPFFWLKPWLVKFEKRNFFYPSKGHQCLYITTNSVYDKTFSLHKNKLYLTRYFITSTFKIFTLLRNSFYGRVISISYQLFSWMTLYFFNNQSKNNT